MFTPTYNRLSAMVFLLRTQLIVEAMVKQLASVAIMKV